LEIKAQEMNNQEFQKLMQTMRLIESQGNTGILSRRIVFQHKEGNDYHCAFQKSYTSYDEHKLNLDTPLFLSYLIFAIGTIKDGQLIPWSENPATLLSVSVNTPFYDKIPTEEFELLVKTPEFANAISTELQQSGFSSAASKVKLFEIESVSIYRISVRMQINNSFVSEINRAAQYAWKQKQRLSQKDQTQ